MGLALVLAAAAPASASAPERETHVEHVSETVGSCGPGDDLLGEWTVTEDVTWRDSGAATLHLQLVGTMTRTGTGVVGKYAERQRDFFSVDGSERYVGAFGHLVVPGGKGFTYAGQVRMSPDGDLSTTPGAAPLLVVDFEAETCAALSGR